MVKYILLQLLFLDFDMKNKFLFVLFCFILFSGSSQSYFDILTFKKTKKETFEFQVKKLEKWKINPQMITVFNEVYIDSICSISYSLDTIMYKDKSFSPIQFRVYRGNMLYTGWQYCFGNLSKFGMLYNDSILDLKKLPINRTLSLENDLKMIQFSDEQKQKIKSVTNYDYIIIVFWDPYLGRSVRKMLQRIQQFIYKYGSQKIYLITVNYNGILDKINK